MITFNGQDFKTRVVTIIGWGDERIAGEGLQKKLFDESGHYVSGEARAVDEKVFFFVEDQYLDKSDEELAAHVNKSL